MADLDRTDLDEVAGQGGLGDGVTGRGERLPELGLRAQGTSGDQGDDRGLAGGFNSGIVRAARERINALLREGKDVRIIAVGKKARDPLRRQFGARLVESFDMFATKALSLDAAQPVADLVLREFDEGRADVVTLFYSRFRSVISQVPTARQLIPAVVEAGAKPVDLNGAVYTYEPDEQSILEALLPRNVAIQILSAMYENAAGEQSARMQAMDNATRNAGELISDLTLLYNRQRQAQITTELIEIIAGAEAV